LKKLIKTFFIVFIIVYEMLLNGLLSQGPSRCDLFQSICCV